MSPFAAVITVPDTVKLVFALKVPKEFANMSTTLFPTQYKIVCDPCVTTTPFEVCPVGATVRVCDPAVLLKKI